MNPTRLGCGAGESEQQLQRFGIQGKQAEDRESSVNALRRLEYADDSTHIDVLFAIPGTGHVFENAKSLLMKISHFTQDGAAVCIAFLLVCSSSHAEIFKWVDADGRTHYSERKEDAGKGNAVEVKVKSDPASTQSSKAPNEYWKEQDRQFKQRQAEKSNLKANAPPEDTNPKALWDGKRDESNTTRCNLAKDILSGAARHSNGKLTDKNDRDIAENDIRLFCR